MSFNHENTAFLEQAPAPATIAGIGEVGLAGALHVLAAEHVTPADLFNTSPCPLPAPDPKPKAESSSYLRHNILVAEEEEEEKPAPKLPQRKPKVDNPDIPTNPDHEHPGPGRRSVTPIRTDRGV